LPARSASAGSNTLFLERKLFNELFQIIDTYRMGLQSLPLSKALFELGKGFRDG